MKDEQNYLKKTKGVLFVEPTCGLCNRLRVIKSAMNLANQYNYSLKIIWRVNNDLGARYNDLFERIDGVQVINVNDSILSKIKYRIKQKFCSISLMTKDILTCRYDLLDEFLANNKPKKIYIKTYEEFYLKNDVGYEWLRPVEKIIQRVDFNLSQVGVNGIGIHIRGKDNILSIQNSPIQVFEHTIENIMQNETVTKFFLATDEEIIKENFLKRFPDVIFTSESILNRCTIEGMMASTVDLFTLSKMRKIYGSYYSSFSETAAAIGKNPLEILMCTREEK